MSETKSQNVSCAEAACGHLVVRLGLHRVDEVGELDAVLDEEDRDVVADEVEVALVGVELGREAAHVARRVGRAARADDRREAHEHRRLRLRVAAGSRPGSAPPATRRPGRSRARPTPRAWTTRSGMRSWSKRVIFSRRWKSSSSVGPRGPALSESSVCGTRTPWSVVRAACSGCSRNGSRLRSLLNPPLRSERPLFRLDFMWEQLLALA